MRPLVMHAVCLIALWTLGCEKADETAQKVAPATTDLGTGLNRVGRTYARPAQDLNDLVPKVLLSFELKMEVDRHDALGGDFTAVRADGSKVSAKITSIDKTHALVSIRVAPGDRNLADLIHQRIAEKLGGPVLQ